jgi:hypothetical protein
MDGGGFPGEQEGMSRLKITTGVYQDEWIVTMAAGNCFCCARNRIEGPTDDGWLAWKNTQRLLRLDEDRTAHR